MLKIKHVPMQLFDVTAFPIMFVLLYTYLFGGALAGSPQEYLQALLPGILVMTVSWITMYTGQALNTDIAKGVFDRFRSLPIWRPAVLVGMLLADAVRYTMASAVIIGLGIVLGFRPDGGVVGVLLAVALLLVFAFSLSWVWTAVGLKMPTPEAVHADQHDDPVPAHLRQQRVRGPLDHARLGAGASSTTTRSPTWPPLPAA